MCLVNQDNEKRCILNKKVEPSAPKFYTGSLHNQLYIYYIINYSLSWGLLSQVGVRLSQVESVGVG